MKKIKIDGDGAFFLLFIPIVIAVVWINYGSKTVIAMSVFFGALYSYYLTFLNLIYCIKDNIAPYGKKCVIYSIISIIFFFSSITLYGLPFSLKPLVVILVVSTVQAIMIFRQ